MKISKLLLFFLSIYSISTFAMNINDAAMNADEKVSLQQAENNLISNKNAHIFIALVAYENIYGPLYAEKAQLIINSAPMYSLLVNLLTQETKNRRPDFRKHINQIYQMLKKQPRT